MEGRIMIEKLKLIFRAMKYRWRDDRGEIEYMIGKIRPGNTVLDIGAHKGGYTWWMMKAAGKSGKTIAFEPQPAGADLLRNLFAGRALVEELAISSVTGERMLHIQPQPNRVSYEASLSRTYPGETTLRVRTMTLDDYCRKYSVNPDFIKIDVEGNESEVISGAIEIIKQCRPVLLAEIEIRHCGEKGFSEMLNLMRQLNYMGSFFYGREMLPLSAFRPELHQADPSIHPYANNFAFEPAEKGYSQ